MVRLRPWLARALSLLPLLGMVGLSCERPQRVVSVPVTLVTALERPSAPTWEMFAYFPNPDPTTQAVGSTHQPTDSRRTDRHAHLKNATRLPEDAPGVTVLNARMGRNYGTYELVELIQQVGAGFAYEYAGQSIRVGDLAARRGGTIRDRSGRRVHSSHRNGLDADVMYLREDCHHTGSVTDRDCPYGAAENLDLIRRFVEGGPDGEDSMVDVIYVGESMKQRICGHLRASPQAAEKYLPILSRVQLMSGHQAHFHVRVKCPETSLRCPKGRRSLPPLCGRGRFAR